MQEQWYKVIAEALRALTEVPRFFTDIGYDNSDDVSIRTKEGTEVASMLYTAIEPLLAAHDVDQEIKECALKACAALLSSLNPYLTEEQSTRLLSLLLDRLRNETTRIAAIRTLSTIATSSSSGDLLAPIFADSILTMSSFLKLASRSIKQSSLEAIDRVVKTAKITSDDSSGSQQKLYTTVLEDVAPLIVDKDMHLSHLSL